MITAPTVVVLGTGAFAQSLVSALLSESTTAHVVILGRSAPAAQQVLDQSVAAQGSERAHSTQSAAVEFGLDTDLTGHLEMLRPEFVVVCASLHSPYTAEHGDDAWTRLLRNTGFGFTGLLQAPLAVRAAEAVARTGGRTKLVNACYPDFVNPLLAALGLPVLCGLGNVATLTVGVCALVPALAAEPPRMLAQHRHLKRGLPPEDDVRTWCPHATSSQISDALEEVRRRPRRQLNDLGAAAGGRLIAALLRGERSRINLPGPHGLPGGYPVQIDHQQCDLDLPAGVTVDDGVTWNQRHAVAEGIQVTNTGCIRFTGPTAKAVRELGIAPGDQIGAEDWELAVRRLLHTRAVLTGEGTVRESSPRTGRTHA